jgi:hypothetical protein
VRAVLESLPIPPKVLQTQLIVNDCVEVNVDELQCELEHKEKVWVQGFGKYHELMVINVMDNDKENKWDTGKFSWKVHVEEDQVHHTAGWLDNIIQGYYSNPDPHYPGKEFIYVQLPFFFSLI